MDGSRPTDQTSLKNKLINHESFDIKNIYEKMVKTHLELQGRFDSRYFGAKNYNHISLELGVK